MAAKKAVRKRKPRIEVYEQSRGLRFGLLKMEPNDQYAVLSAVRGPDNHNQAGGAGMRCLKAAITERIRGIVFVKDCPGQYTTVPLSTPLSIVEGYAKNARSQQGGQHFIDHLRLAVKATQGHPIWNGHGAELVSLLSRYAV
jgi:hypothetical protein